MRLHIALHLLAFLLTSLAEQTPPPLQVPPAVTIDAGRMAIIEAKSAGPVRWAVFPRTATGPDIVRIDDATGKRVAFVAAKPGTYTLFAATVVDGQVSEFVECIIVVTGVAPGPGPGPGPDPQPPPTPHVREFEASWRADLASGSPEATLVQLTAIYEAAAATTWPTWESLVDHIKDRYDRTIPPASGVKLRAEIARVMNTELYPRARPWDTAAATATLTRITIALKEVGGGPPGPGPEPTDPLWQSLKAAWTAETASDKKDQAKRLAAFYREAETMAKTLQVPLAVDLHMAMVARRRTLGLDGVLPAVRQALTEEFDKQLPRQTAAPLDSATREKAAVLFAKTATLLERLP